ncbi:hypothetical protein ACFFWE_34780 [Sphaerisporangium melleum]|uniref:effector-associated constant component EACC1 n=1 Tax=Sphaerisporangium melleum TaxID=321316 RepID=UPI00166DBEA7|nr:hypothetical protein [Sphaerisporangium melleum]
MEVSITVVSDEPALDLDDLRGWLDGERDLRGRVTAVPAPPPEGVLGPVVDVLLVALGPAGAVTGLVAVLVTWVRRRPHPNVTVEVTRPDGGTLKVSGTDLDGLDGELIARYMDRAAAILNGEGAPAVADPGEPPALPGSKDAPGGAGRAPRTGGGTGGGGRASRARSGPGAQGR